MRHPVLLTLAAASGLGLAGLAVYQVAATRRAQRVEADLLRPEESPRLFSQADLDGRPEPVRRYLRHAIALGAPLSAGCRLWMEGTMTPTPGAPPTSLTAVETLAPRQGFVWTARARMNGLPVRVRDHYAHGAGGVRVTALGVVPIPLPGTAADVARSSRGRLVGEAVWCPTALVHPSVTWEAVSDTLAQFTLAVDGEPVTVALRVGADGALQEVLLERWGDPDGRGARLHPYGFRVDAEGTFGGVTIPTQITGGWGYGTDGYDPETAASFTLVRADFAGP